MKKMTLRITGFATALFLFFACQKESSFENGGFSGTATGTLLDNAGNCQDIVVNGKYIVDTTLTDSNYIKLNVNFTSQGKYLISSDTVNGMWFLDSGFALSSGTTSVKVKAKGKPLLANSSTFTVTFNGNSCTFSVTATADGSSTGGGNTGADYFPVTAGSSWSYQYSPKIDNVDNFVVTVAGATVTYDSLNYYKFGTPNGDTSYFAKNTTIGNYYALGFLEFDYTAIFDSVPNLPVAYPFLKERAAVNESWESVEYGTVRLTTNNVTERGKAKATFTILAKNSSLTVGGKTYSDVTKVQRELKFMPNGGTYRTILTGNSYYGKGYGLLFQEITSPGATGTQLVQVTKEPTIK